MNIYPIIAQIALVVTVAVPLIVLLKWGRR